MAVEKHIIGGSDGWLNVRREPEGALIALPEYLLVEYEATHVGRDYFKVLEGVEKGNRFTVKEGNLKHGRPVYRPAANLKFDLSAETLTYPGGTIRAITSSSKPTPVGTHPIQIADFPHGSNPAYGSHSRYYKTWFYLGKGRAIAFNNDRYLHTGMVSDGCVTVDPSSWTDLYRYLILCRRNDATNIGTITVVR